MIRKTTMLLGSIILLGAIAGITIYSNNASAELVGSNFGASTTFVNGIGENDIHVYDMVLGPGHINLKGALAINNIEEKDNFSLFMIPDTGGELFCIPTNSTLNSLLVAECGVANPTAGDWTILVETGNFTNPETTHIGYVITTDSILSP